MKSVNVARLDEVYRSFKAYSSRKLELIQGFKGVMLYCHLANGDEHPPSILPGPCPGQKCLKAFVDFCDGLQNGSENLQSVPEKKRKRLDSVDRHVSACDSCSNEFILLNEDKRDDKN